MDSRKARILGENLAHYKRIQENGSVNLITLHTVDGQKFGIGNAAAIQLLLSVAITELERQLHTARFGDIPERLKESREYKAAKELEQALNDTRFNPERFAEALPYFHKTLEQTFFRVMKAVSPVWQNVSRTVLTGETGRLTRCAGCWPPCWKRPVYPLSDSMKHPNNREADFRTKKLRSAFSFLAAKVTVCRADCARRPLKGLVGRKKIILAPLRYFLSPSLAAIPGKQAGKTSRNKNAYPCRPMSH